MVQPKKKTGTQNSPFGQDGLCGELGARTSRPLSGSRRWRGIPLRGSLVLQLPINKCQVPGTFVTIVYKRGQKPACGQGAQGRRWTWGRLSLQFTCPEKIIFSQWRKFSMRIRTWYSVSLSFVFFLFYYRTFMGKKNQHFSGIFFLLRTLTTDRVKHHNPNNTFFFSRHEGLQKGRFCRRVNML